MNLTNGSYEIWMGTKNFKERYYRDKDGWAKVSARGRVFRMTAEQVLNHLLPAVAEVKAGLWVRVEHRDAARPEPTQSVGGRARNPKTKSAAAQRRMDGTKSRGSGPIARMNHGFAPIGYSDRRPKKKARGSSPGPRA